MCVCLQTAAAQDLTHTARLILRHPANRGTLQLHTTLHVCPLLCTAFNSIQGALHELPAAQGILQSAVSSQLDRGIHNIILTASTTDFTALPLSKCLWWLSSACAILSGCPAAVIAIMICCVIPRCPSSRTVWVLLHSIDSSL